MTWADQAIKILQRGSDVVIKPRGNSMKPKVKNGESVIISPLISDLSINDIVLVKVKGRIYLHLIKAIDGERYQIGNDRHHINGWVRLNSIYGKAVGFPDRNK